MSAFPLSVSAIGSKPRDASAEKFGPPAGLTAHASTLGAMDRRQPLGQFSDAVGSGAGHRAKLARIIFGDNAAKTLSGETTMRALPVTVVFILLVSNSALAQNDGQAAAIKKSGGVLCERRSPDKARRR
jgi:hypothetical protein